MLLEYTAVLHHRDIVEEIATRRQGEIDAIDRYISEGNQLPPGRWRVRFLDGGEPRFQYVNRSLLPYQVQWSRGKANLAKCCLRGPKPY